MVRIACYILVLFSLSCSKKRDGEACTNTHDCASGLVCVEPGVCAPRAPPVVPASAFGELANAVCACADLACVSTATDAMRARVGDIKQLTVTNAERESIMNAKDRMQACIDKLSVGRPDAR